MKISEEGINLICAFETFVPHVYDDARPMFEGGYREWKGEVVRGTLTIGYGHTEAAGEPKIKRGMKVTEFEAKSILASDLEQVEADVVKRVVLPMQALGKEPLNQHEFDAVVSFQFNCNGLVRRDGMRSPSNACSALINGNRHGFITEMGKWIKPAWASKGLLKRRAAEAAHFYGNDWRPFVP